MSAGLWCRMREGLIAAGQPVTARELAEAIGAVDELPGVRNVLYIQRRCGAHVEKLPPASPGEEYRWRLLRDARERPLKRGAGKAGHPVAMRMEGR